MPTFIHDMTAHDFQQLQDMLKRDLYRHTKEDVERVFQVGDAIAKAIDLGWAKINELLNRGEEGRRLRFMLLELKDVLDFAVLGLPEIRDKVRREAPGFEAKQDGLLALAESIRRVETIRDEVNKLLSFLSHSPPAVEVSTLTSAGAVKDAKGYLSLEQMLSQTGSEQK
jgi:hypothetical protein